MRFFFYGTLLDADLRRAVIGPSADGLAIFPATLRNWRRWRRRRQSYPVISPCSGATVDGIVVACVTRAAAARLAAYEGPGYRVAAVWPVRADGCAIRAFAFVPLRNERPGNLHWNEAVWRRRHRGHAVAAASGNCDPRVVRHWPEMIER